MSNNYYSNFAIIISYITYRLFEHGCVYRRELNLDAKKICRYIANIRMMLAEKRIYDIENERYILFHIKDDSF